MKSKKIVYDNCLIFLKISNREKCVILLAYKPILVKVILKAIRIFVIKRISSKNTIHKNLALKSLT